MKQIPKIKVRKADQPNEMSKPITKIQVYNVKVKKGQNIL
jgi:hypothetical protein